MRETSSPARLDHSCVQNALLEMVSFALKYKGGGVGGGNVLTLTGFLSWRKALTCQTRGCCYWWEIIRSANLSFMKRILFGWLSRS
jgi:hypothetical protein